MFTGIVEELGEVRALRVDPDGGHATVTVHGPKVVQDVRHGDSIAVSGVCLTVVAATADSFTADLMAETLSRTSAGTWASGRPVNLERSVRADGRLGGHVVQGHVDGVGTVTDRTAHPGYDEIRIEIPADLGRFLAPKGAVAVDGTSLTVIEVCDTARGTVFSVGIIPQTRAVTTLGLLQGGSTVNIEVDVMAKYVARLLSRGSQGDPE